MDRATHYKREIEKHIEALLDSYMQQYGVQITDLSAYSTGTPRFSLVNRAPLLSVTMTV